MKKTMFLLSVAAVMLLALTGCTSRNKTNPTYPNADYNEYDDYAYDADEYGMTNENGQDGTNRYPSGNGSTTTRPGSVANGVQDAVDEAGNVVDDIANGAANAVDDTTDAIGDAAGAVTGKNRVNKSSSAA